jgi:hypothetical protein
MQIMGFHRDGGFADDGFVSTWSLIRIPKSLPPDMTASAEPKELLEFSICLDFRSVYGEAELANELCTFVYKVLQDRPSLLLAIPYPLPRWFSHERMRHVPTKDTLSRNSG